MNDWALREEEVRLCKELMGYVSMVLRRVWPSATVMLRNFSRSSYAQFDRIPEICVTVPVENSQVSSSISLSDLYVLKERMLEFRKYMVESFVHMISRELMFNERIRPFDREINFYDAAIIKVGKNFQVDLNYILLRP